VGIGKWGFRLTRTVTPDALAGTGMTERAVVVGASCGRMDPVPKRLFA